MVTGSWGFASGCLHSQWAVLGIPVVDENGEQIDQGLALIPMTDLTIKDTWHVAGMKGTGSNTLIADAVFVPDHRIVSVPQAIDGDYGTEHTEESLYRSAFVPVLALVLVGAQVGLAKQAFEIVTESLAKGTRHQLHLLRQVEPRADHAAPDVPGRAADRHRRAAHDAGRRRHRRRRRRR